MGQLAPHNVLRAKKFWEFHLSKNWTKSPHLACCSSHMHLLKAVSQLSHYSNFNDHTKCICAAILLYYVKQVLKIATKKKKKKDSKLNRWSLYQMDTTQVCQTFMSQCSASRMSHSLQIITSDFFFPPADSLFPKDKYWHPSCSLEVILSNPFLQ